MNSIPSQSTLSNNPTSARSAVVFKYLLLSAYGLTITAILVTGLCAHAAENPNPYTMQPSPFAALRTCKANLAEAKRKTPPDAEEIKSYTDECALIETQIAATTAQMQRKSGKAGDYEQCMQGVKDTEAEANNPKTGAELAKALKDAIPAMQKVCLNAVTGAQENERRCERLSEEISRSDQAARKACSQAKLGNDYGRCVDQIKACDQAESDIAGETFQRDTPGNDFCDVEVANNCPNLSAFMDGRDYRQEEKDAERSLKDSKKDLEDALNDQRELQTDIIKQQQAVQEAVSDSQIAMGRKQKEVVESVKNGMQNMSSDQKKAFDDAQKTYNEMDAAYVGLRKQRRDAADAVVDAMNTLETVCRGVAEEKFQKADAQRLAAQAKGRRNLGSSTSMSGQNKRLKMKKAKAKALDYMAFYNECKNGTTKEGAAAKQQIARAERAAASVNAEINDKTAIIENQRQQMLVKLKDMETQASSSQKQLIEQANERLKELGEDYDRSQQKLQTKLTAFQQEQTVKKLRLDQRYQSSQTEMTKYQQESLFAKRRQSCGGRALSMSESARDRIGDGFGSGASEVEALALDCKKWETNLCGDKGKPSACDRVDYAVGSQIDKKTGRKRENKSFRGGDTDQ